MTPIEIIILAIFSCLIGFLGGYAGVAGAPFLIFFLTVFLGFTQHEAQGTVLAVMLGPMTLFGVIAHLKEIKPYVKYIVIAVLTYAIFSFAGASIAYLFPPRILKIFFGIVLILISLRGLSLKKSQIGKILKEENEKPVLPLNMINFGVIGILAGVIGGAFGIASGIIIIPILIGVFKLNKNLVRGICLAILTPPVSFGAVLRYNLDINWLVAGIIFLSYFSVNYFGAKLAKNHSTEVFTRVFSIIMFFLGIITIYMGITTTATAN